MLRRGVTRGDIARSANVGVGHITNVLAGNKRSAPLRRKIEAILQVSLWSSPEEFLARLPLIKFYGSDVETLSNAELSALAKKTLPGAASQRVPESPAEREHLLRLLRVHYQAAAKQPAPEVAAAR